MHKHTRLAAVAVVVALGALASCTPDTEDRPCRADALVLAAVERPAPPAPRPPAVRPAPPRPPAPAPHVPRPRRTSSPHHHDDTDLC